LLTFKVGHWLIQTRPLGVETGQYPVLLGKAVHAEVVFVQNDGLHKKLSELHKNPTEFLGYCAKPPSPLGQSAIEIRMSAIGT